MKIVEILFKTFNYVFIILWFLQPIYIRKLWCGQEIRKLAYLAAQIRWLNDKTFKVIHTFKYLVISLWKGKYLDFVKKAKSFNILRVLCK